MNTMVEVQMTVSARDVRDGDVLIEGNESLTVGKVEALCVPGEETMYRVCDRYDSRIGWWYDRYDHVTIVRGAHQHTTYRCL